MDPSFIPDNTLDFHNLGILDDYLIEKYTIEFLEDNYNAQKDSLLIIVGKGKKVRPRVHEILQKHKLVNSFKSASLYNGGKGAFEVQLINE